GDLVVRPVAGRLAGDGEGVAHVHHVGRAALALELLDRVQLVLAGTLGVRVGDLNAVLGGERLHDRAVVRPVGRQRDDVEVPLRLGGGDKGVHAAHGGGRGGGARVRRRAW